MRTVQEWRQKVADDPELDFVEPGAPTFLEFLDDLIAQGLADDWLKVTFVDTGEAMFQVALRRHPRG